VRTVIFIALLGVAEVLHSATMPKLPDFHMEDFGAPCTLLTDIQEHTCDLVLSPIK
jgi:hypothetical protein